MAVKKTHLVEVRRSGRWWAITAPQLRGVFSQARRLADVEPMARDAIAAVLDVPPRSFDVVIRPIVGERLESMVREARESRATAQEAQIQASDLSVRALRSLQKAGISLRDVGELLGVSHQRAAQMANADLRPIRTARRKAIAELRGRYRV